MTAEEFKNSVLPYSGKLYPLLGRILANDEEIRDALQEIMLKLWNKRDKLEELKCLEAYIITVAKNYCIDLKKKKKPSYVDGTSSILFLNIEDRGLDPDIKEKYELVQQAIAGLPDKYQTILQLRDIDGFSFKEIKEMMNLEVANIRVILSRARRKVKEEVEKIMDYEDKRQFTKQIL